MSELPEQLDAKSTQEIAKIVALELYDCSVDARDRIEAVALAKGIPDEKIRAIRSQFCPSDFAYQHCESCHRILRLNSTILKVDGKFVCSYCGQLNYVDYARAFESQFAKALVREIRRRNSKHKWITTAMKVIGTACCTVSLNIFGVVGIWSRPHKKIARVIASVFPVFFAFLMVFNGLLALVWSLLSVSNGLSVSYVPDAILPAMLFAIMFISMLWAIWAEPAGGVEYLPPFSWFSKRSEISETDQGQSAIRCPQYSTEK